MGCSSCRRLSISVVLRRFLKSPLGLDNSWGVCSQSQRAGNQPLQAGDEKSSPFGLEAQLLGHLACEHGAEKSRHYRFRDLLYCGVSLRQPRPRLHPKKAHTFRWRKNAPDGLSGLHDHATICSRLVAALTSGTYRQFFQFRNPRRPPEREWRLIRFWGLGVDSLLAAITRYAPRVSLAAREAPNLVRKRAS